MDTSVLSVVFQPILSEGISFLIKAGFLAVMGLAIWGLKWLGTICKKNAISEGLFNLALRFLHAKAEDEKAVGNVVDYLKKHKPSWIGDADFDEGMRAAMKKATDYLNATDIPK